MLQRIGATIATATEHVLCEPLPEDWLVRMILLHVREQAPKAGQMGPVIDRLVPAVLPNYRITSGRRSH